MEPVAVAVGGASEDLLQACRRMLDLRGDDWTPAPAAWAADTRITALGSQAFHVPARGQLLVVSEQPRVGTQHLKALAQAMEEHGIRRTQIIARTAITIQTQSVVPLGSRLTVLLWHVVLMRPLDHSLVPGHRRARPDELRQLEERYGVALSRRATAAGAAAPAVQVLPALRADDPVALYLGLQVGDVVRIDRHDGTVFFRVVAGVRHARACGTPTRITAR